MPREPAHTLTTSSSRGEIHRDVAKVDAASFILETNRPPVFFNNVSRVTVTVKENLGAGTDITQTESEQYEWTATDPDGDDVTYDLEGPQS